MIIVESEIGISLQTLINKNRYKDIGSVTGITILEERDWIHDEHENNDCVTYVFGTKHKMPGNLLFHNKPEKDGYRVVETPLEGDLVVYYKKEQPMHVGLATQKGVKSKWGHGYVYDHPLTSVPKCFGDEVRFYRKELRKT